MISNTTTGKLTETQHSRDWRLDTMKMTLIMMMKTLMKNNEQMRRTLDERLLEFEINVFD